MVPRSGAAETVVKRTLPPRLPAMPEDRPRRQRIAAYAVLTRRHAGVEEVLLTRMSSRTRIEARWTLPGGGLDHGEDPRDALRREVFEETGLHVEPGRGLDVHSSHFVGGRSGGPVGGHHGGHPLFGGPVV